MELFIDTADLGEIAEAKEHLQLAGVTTNPTIIRKASPKDFFGHMSKIRFIIGKECSLHIQVTASSSAEQLKQIGYFRNWMMKYTLKSLLTGKD